MKKAVITGGAGFIGSNLADKLVADGFSVTIIDNFSTGNHAFLGKHDYHVVDCDIRRDFESITSAMEGASIAYHLAANADVRFGWEHPRLDLEQNVIATLNVLDAAVANDVSEFVFSSTGSIYGEAKTIPTPEDYGLPIQTSLYGASKYAAESYVAAYASAEKIKATIFRFVSVLGPRYTHGHVIDFVRQLRADPSALTILGDGTQRKSYMHVDDCVNGVANVRSELDVDVFNLGTNETCTVNQSALWICEAMDVNPTFHFTGGARGWVGDNPHIHLDNSKSLEHGWEVSRSIKDSVFNTVNWLLQNPEICDGV